MGDLVPFSNSGALVAVQQPIITQEEYEERLKGVSLSGARVQPMHTYRYIHSASTGIVNYLLASK
jgi:hypothetical protein